MICLRIVVTLFSWALALFWRDRFERPVSFLSCLRRRYLCKIFEPAKIVGAAFLFALSSEVDCLTSCIKAFANTSFRLMTCGTDLGLSPASRSSALDLLLGVFALGLPFSLPFDDPDRWILFCSFHVLFCNFLFLSSSFSISLCALDSALLTLFRVALAFFALLKLNFTIKWGTFSASLEALRVWRFWVDEASAALSMAHCFSFCSFRYFSTRAFWSSLRFLRALSSKFAAGM